ncbi:hypothetical protein [Amphritea pacifica]|uniref:Zinc ribbon domain-containing protein n=1 Tax=Amphritea pacifica TaxID=2811233 RepID=A0ABS2WAC2_9GAMM|nr:hypothetical protein [Amphritea pacifica]MBN0988536.1 hypothetical protein [Amphritea pacifica]MBN1006744.1 hypothetical protein [Amphritea pacifica]
MAMIKCAECGHTISDKAELCISCGCPSGSAIEASTKQTGMSSAWSAVTRSRTPINLFAIAMMCCASILGMSATQIDGPDSLKAFTYTLHVFMAVTGMFFVTILFCRKGVYHPDDLAKAKRDGLSDEMGADRPVIAAVLIIIMLSAYAAYQAVYAD